MLLLAFLGLMGLGGGVASSTPGELWVDDDPGCGGHSPCFSSIQEAVDAASTSATIWVRPGLYEETVTITKWVNLVGELSGGQVVIRSPDPQQPVIQVLQVPQATEEGEARGVVTVGLLPGGLLRNLTITGGRVGLFLQRTDYRVQFNQIVGNRDAGIVIEGGSPRVRGNEISWTSGVCGVQEYKGVVCEGGDGIRVTGLEEEHSGPDIVGNAISHNYGWGIKVLGLEEGMDQQSGEVEIERNSITDNGGSFLEGGGISIERVAKAEVNYNHVEGNGWGIRIVAVSGTVIKHNHVSENGGSGIGVYDSLKAEVSYNQLLNNDSGVILDYIDQGTVVYNFIQGNQRGITIRGLLLDRSEGYIAIKYNNIQDNEWSGLLMVDIASGGKIEIYRNEILTNRWGVWLVHTEAMTTMEQNTLEGNEHGVVVDASRVMLNENRIVRNEGWGVVLSDDTFPSGRVWCLSGEIDWTEWDVRGVANEMYENSQGNLCPEDYPWPEGFVREESG